MKRSMMYAACFAMILAVPLTGYAQKPSRSDGDKTASDRRSAAPDEKFITRVAQDNKAEADLGRLASERGTSDSVKQFGQRMATDHGKAGEELAQLAQQKGIMLPTNADARHRKLYDRLSKLSGADFDREYMRQMIRDHDAEVKAFQREAQRAKDPDVRAWIEKTLPELKEHQQQAHQLQASLKGTKSTTRSRDKASQSSGGSASPSSAK